MMETPLEPKYQEALDGWLERATKFLCPEAKRRIRRDIEEHYLGVFDRWIDAGKSHGEAHAMGIKSLGSSLKACWRFQEIHLSVEEADKLRKLKSIPGPLWLSLVGLGAGIAVFLYSYYVNVRWSDRWPTPAPGLYPAMWLAIIFFGLPSMLSWPARMTVAEILKWSRIIFFGAHGLYLVGHWVLTLLLLRHSHVRKEWDMTWGGDPGPYFLYSPLVLILAVAGGWCLFVLVQFALVSYTWKKVVRKLGGQRPEEYFEESRDD